MANAEHLRRLKEGVVAWNKWREENPEIVPDLREARLRGANLSDASLSGADLVVADLSEANLRGADLHEATLSGASLRKADLTNVDFRRATLAGETDVRWANLHNANLEGADLREADFGEADLYRANLSKTDLGATNFSKADLSKVKFHRAKIAWTRLNRANLFEASLSEANLIGANLSEADIHGGSLWDTDFRDCTLEGTNFASCRMNGATFANVDLSQAKGLNAVEHMGPSTIGIDTIYRSLGKIPEIFLRGAGVPDNFITYMHSLAGEAFDYYSCFISFSSKDQDFANLLHARLQQEGVRCWFAPEDLKTGDRFRQRIDEAILVYDKLLLVLSKDSIQSSWVEEEVEAALEKERRENKLVLFPVRLDDAIMETKMAWAASLRRARHIADFTKWKEHDHYQTAFKRLLRDLQGEVAKDASAGAEF